MAGRGVSRKENPHETVHKPQRIDLAGVVGADMDRMLAGQGLRDGARRCNISGSCDLWGDQV